jgi:hypothetical protein
VPGAGLGVSAGVHVYVLSVGPVTLGVGAHATIGRARFVPATVAGQPSSLRPVTETFKSIAPQVSLNFGSGNGWSYLSAGIGRSIWSIVPDGRSPWPADRDLVRTINYGGGARWFAKRHLAFSLDVRLHEIPDGPPHAGLPGAPHTLLLIVGAGISVK